MLAAAVVHHANFLAGWGMILAGFLVGAAVGVFFHQPSFLGGYASFPRRMLRLGHIALVALGFLNVLLGICPAGGFADRYASMALIAGGLAMPVVCFLTAWREPFRHLFFLPVLCLVSSVVCILIGGVS